MRRQCHILDTDLAVERQRAADRTEEVERLCALLAGALATDTATIHRGTLTLPPVTSRIEKALLAAITASGPLHRDTLEEDVRGLGAFTGKRLRKVADDLVAA